MPQEDAQAVQSITHAQRADFRFYSDRAHPFSIAILDPFQCVVERVTYLLLGRAGSTGLTQAMRSTLSAPPKTLNPEPWTPDPGP